MSNHIEHSPRTPWDVNFPDVVTFCTVAERDRLDSYTRAKYTKNHNQAMEMMDDLASTKGYKEAIKKLKALAGKDDVIIVPIHSLEQGYDARKKKPAIASNPLPTAIALAIADETGWEIDTSIVQKNIAGHTGADTLTRFAHPALFDGQIQKDKKYLIVDDHVSMGGTVANCKGYIEKNGGKVIGVSALTANRGGLCVRLTPRSQNRLLNAENFASIGCHAELCEKVFGYSIDCMTNTEACQIFHQLEVGRKKKPNYTLQNFFDEVIQTRKDPDALAGLTQAKSEITRQRLDGSHTPRHTRDGVVFAATQQVRP